MFVVGKHEALLCTLYRRKHSENQKPAAPLLAERLVACLIVVPAKHEDDGVELKPKQVLAELGTVRASEDQASANQAISQCRPSVELRQESFWPPSASAGVIIRWARRPEAQWPTNRRTTHTKSPDTLFAELERLCVAKRRKCGRWWDSQSDPPPWSERLQR